MMRTLFLVMVVANVVAFIWFGWLKPPAPTPAFTPLPQVQPLKLIAELTPAERRDLAHAPQSAPAGSRPASAATGAASCMSYGPFPSAEAAASGSARLRTAGAEVTQRLVPGKVRSGYWVYLPPFGSRREAEAAAKLLQRRGVKDLYVVTDEANRNAISLGVFSDRFGALAHQKKIRALGYHPLLTERFRDAPRYWLDARGAEQQLPAASVFTDLDEGDVTVGRSACAAGDGA
ncbi:MAG: SPOR domain-containing protein [Gammaproteobacteria bacterium]|nr:SPOR domain-containing protein [Gammaproteobacteria bacterium]MBU6509974.1 SPOR domain-containing protein [Gammaproteobacteria bacterium]MDE2108696.1 SPOR domain-containing protein [Gammaproteobacteria bacterium]MDE2460059.1 SPOR domain-containing protein [Gammaproteobacteria bacterium]